MAISLSSCALGALGGCGGALCGCCLLARASDPDAPRWRWSFRLRRSRIQKRQPRIVAQPRFLPSYTETFTDDLDSERDLTSGVELVNDVIKRKWPYISRWFGNMLHESVGQTLLTKSWQQACLTECHLGTTPAKVTLLRTASFLQDWPCAEDDRRTLRAECAFEYSGDGKIVVATPAGSVEFSPVLTGTLLLELVKQTDECPWFLGLRIYFPDTPDLHFKDFERPDFLDTAAYLFTGFRLDTIILEEITKVIVEFGVQPNCFALPLWAGPGLDPILLQSPRPQGVLRVATAPDASVARWAADPKRDAEPWVSAMGIWKYDAPRDVCDTFVEFVLGATSSGKLRFGEAHDFVLTEGLWKRLRVTVHVGQGKNAQTSADVTLCDLVKHQQGNEPSTFTVRIPPFGDVLGGRLQLSTVWRSFARGNEDAQAALALCPEPGSAGDGQEQPATWALVVDLYHAEGMPVVDSGTSHWVHVSLLGTKKWSVGAAAETPAEHGKAALRELGLAADVVDALAGPAAAASVPPQAWRRLANRDGPPATRDRCGGGGAGSADAAGVDSGSGAAAAAAAAAGVDVVWNQSICCLLNADVPVADVIKGVTVMMNVWRRRKESSSQADAPPKGCERVGCAVYPLQALVDELDFRSVVHLPLQIAGAMGVTQGVAHLKVGLQIRVLKPAAGLSAGSPRSWTGIGGAYGKQLRSLSSNVVSSLTRACSNDLRT